MDVSAKFFSASLLCIALLYAAVATLTPLHAVHAYFIAVNAVSFIFFGVDKSAARRGGLRVPENVIYILAGLGGSPAILLGMHVFRHKTLSASFQFALTLVFVAQLALARALFV